MLQSAGPCRIDPLASLPALTDDRLRARTAYDIVLAERNAALLRVNEEHGPLSPTYRTIKDRVVDDRRRFEQLRTLLRRPVVRVQLPLPVIAAAVAALSLLLLPGNAFLFTAALPGHDVLAYIVAFVATALLVAVAYAAGGGLRQVWSHVDTRIVPASVLTFVAGLGCLGGAISVLAVARSVADPAASGFGGLVAMIAARLDDRGVSSVLLDAFSHTAALVLVSANAIGLALAWVLGFMTRDRDVAYDRADRARVQSEAQYTHIYSALLAERASVVTEFADRLRSSAATFNAINTRITKLKSDAGAMLDEDDRLRLSEDVASDADASFRASAPKLRSVRELEPAIVPGE